MDQMEVGDIFGDDSPVSSIPDTIPVVAALLAWADAAWRGLASLVAGAGSNSRSTLVLGLGACALAIISQHVDLYSLLGSTLTSADPAVAFTTIFVCVVLGAVFGCYCCCMAAFGDEGQVRERVAAPPVRFWWGRQRWRRRQASPSSCRAAATPPSIIIDARCALPPFPPCRLSPSRRRPSRRRCRLLAAAT